jgi:hypothetical protein
MLSGRGLDLHTHQLLVQESFSFALFFSLSGSGQCPLSSAWQIASKMLRHSNPKLEQK